MDQQAYTSLRNQLLVTLRARAAEVQGPEREFYLRLEGLISPWVSVRSLAREDREILQDLLARCQQVERMLERRSARASAWGWLVAVSLVLGVASTLLLWELVIK